ncbi:MAG: FAD-dependent oxidoreductase [Kiritimatiellae bacterium]|nr:FAD-dependent oxidoreductase [Kiritimatiellia bacterium]
MRTHNPIAVLGGGPAGLGAGYFLRACDRSFCIYETADRVGGNCVTHELSGFLFDSGAHRLHNKDPEITQIITDLVGNDLLRVDVPSAIYDSGRFVDFPLSPLNLLSTLGLREVWCSSADWLLAKLHPVDADHFGALAVNRYGRRLANRFLLNYSEKLWGESPERLSAGISGGRLKGLTIKTFLMEGLLGRTKKTAHLDGTFLYPRRGYGVIAERLADACGRTNIRLGQQVTRVLHADGKIEAIELNHADRVEVGQVISTLPLPLFIERMDPPAPPGILDLARRLRFRNVLLVGLILDRSQVMTFATLYFPSSKYPFTRVFEPANRSTAMVPRGRTSLLVEIPVADGGPPDDEAVESLKRQTVEQLCDIGLIAREEISDVFSLCLPHAYPVLELGVEERVASILNYLSGFTNLSISGRNARFEHASLHNTLRRSKDTVAQMGERTKSARSAHNGEVTLEAAT